MNATTELRRVQLPAARNELLRGSVLHGAQFQGIPRDDPNPKVMIGRVKVPHPTQKDGYSFLLRRYDADAISISSMFKCAFPYATDAEEKTEMDYVKKTYDCTIRLLEGSDRPIRLLGLWAPIPTAQLLAEQYGISEQAAVLIDADRSKIVLKVKTKSGSSIITPMKITSTPSTTIASNTSNSTSSPSENRSERVLRSTIASSSNEQHSTAASNSITGTSSPKAKRVRKSSVEPKNQTDSAKNGLIAQSSHMVSVAEEKILAEIESSKQIAKDTMDKMKSKVKFAETAPGSGETMLGQKRSHEAVAETKAPLDLNILETSQVERLHERPLIQRRGVATVVGILAMGVGYAVTNILPKFL